MSHIFLDESLTQVDRKGARRHGTTERRYRAARSEATHVMLAETYDATVKGVWLGEDGGGVTEVHAAKVDPEARLEIWLADFAGQIADACIESGKMATNWRTLAAAFLQSSCGDARLVRHDLVGLNLTRDEARDYIAGTLRAVVNDLMERRAEWDKRTKMILNGDLTPKRPGGHFWGSDGRPVYYGESDAPYPSTEQIDIPDVDPFRPEPKARKPLRLIRNSAGKLLGIGREGDDLGE